MWAKLAGVLFEKIIGGIIQMFNKADHDATKIKEGVAIVTDAQQKDTIKKAKRAKKVQAESRAATDDELDAGMERPKND